MATSKSDVEEIREAVEDDDAAIRAGLPTAAEKRAAQKQAETSGDPGFSRERLLGPEGATITGHPAYVLAGALHGQDADSFTRDQIGKLVDKFLKARVHDEEAAAR